MHRRELLNAALALPGAALFARLDPARAPGLAAELAQRDGDPEEDAADEDLWREVQQAFTVDRSIVNFNNGGVSPSPRVVQEALARHLAFANQAPAHNMWRVQEPHKESVRARLARLFGCDAEEVAITRNASEGLQTCQLGHDLRPGDEVLTSTQDYPRMVNTFKQRERREGLVLRQVALPAPVEDPAEIARRFEAGITDRTRLILVSHVVFLTGAVLPVRDVVELGRARGIPVIVDGAHAFAHVPCSRDALGCDYYATSLHKWLFAPFGTGMLYVRRERVADLWPLMAAPADRTDDVRKFEEIGTHPVPVPLAIAEALTFHEALGPERKLARMVYLRDRWARRLLEHDRVRLHTSLAPGAAGGFATVEVAGVEPSALVQHLMRRHQILTTPIVHRGQGEDDAFQGVRVSPSVYSTLEEVDRFTDAMLDVVANGLPA